MPELKDYAAFVGVAVSAAAAWLAYDAGGQARLAAEESAEVSNALALSKNRTDTSVKLLDLAYTSFNNAKNGKEKVAACQFMVKLGVFEQATLTSTLIADLHVALAEGDEIDPLCKQKGEALDTDARLAETVQAETPGSAANAIGKWHAVIASYEVTPSGCASAKNVQASYKSLLPQDQFPNATLGIYKTAISKVYAVTLDLEDDESKARQAVQTIREIGASGRAKEGSDSFLQKNRDWTVDPNCDQHTSF